MQAKEAIDRTFKSVRRFLAHFKSGACAGTVRAHAILEWPENGEQTWGKPASRLKAKEAIDGKLKVPLRRNFSNSLFLNFLNL